MIRDSRRAAVRYGKPADVQIFAGHTRFATTSKASLDGTHPHQWTPKVSKGFPRFIDNPAAAAEAATTTAPTTAIAAATFAAAFAAAFAELPSRRDTIHTTHYHMINSRLPHARPRTTCSA